MLVFDVILKKIRESWVRDWRTVVCTVLFFWKKRFNEVINMEKSIVGSFR